MQKTIIYERSHECITRHVHNCIWVSSDRKHNKNSRACYSYVPLQMDSLVKREPLNNNGNVPVDDDTDSKTTTVNGKGLWVST